MLPKYFWVYGLPLECDRLTRGYTFRVNCLSPSLARGETSCPLSLWWDLVQLEPAQALCMLSPLQWVYLCWWPAVSGRCCFLVVLHPLWFLHSFCPLFRNDPWELGGRRKKFFFCFVSLFVFWGRTSFGRGWLWTLGLSAFSSLMLGLQACITHIQLEILFSITINSIITRGLEYTLLL